MERRYVLCGVALLSAACAPKLYTPASAASYWAEEPGPIERVLLPDYAYAAAAWTLPPESAWAPYTKLTLLLALKDLALAPTGDAAAGPPSPAIAELPEVGKLESVKSAHAAAARLAQIGLPDDAMWVVDLRGPASVAFGTSLTQRAQLPLAVVPTFNNWPGDNEVIPAEETLAAMVQMFPRRPLPGEAYARPVFLLDAWRLAYRSEEISDDAFDNRYFLTQADLPDVERLRSQGIRRVVYVVEDAEAVRTEEDDLHPVFFAYAQAGISVHLVDLAWLQGRSPEPGWADVLMPRVLVVEPRTTVLEDQRFYMRARGGFGGIHAYPGRSHYGIMHFRHHHFHRYSGGG